jgi:hypothetical protein
MQPANVSYQDCQIKRKLLIDTVQMYKEPSIES